MMRRALVLAGCVLSLGLSCARAAPLRVVSLNPCLDTILVAVAERDQIAALSHYARDPYSSNIATIAATMPITYETAEEVIALDPDLVLTSRHSAIATRNALRRMNIKTELFDVPDTVEASIAQIRQVAGLIDRVSQGDAVIARIEAALDAARPPADAAPIPALLLQPNGFTVGAGTLSDEMFQRTGFVNAAARYGIGKAGNVPLERLIADPPAMLFAGAPPADMPGWAERVLRNPAVRHVSDRIHRATFPQRLMYCGGPVLIETAAVLAAARDDFMRGAP